MACKGLDAQVVRPEDAELAELLNRYVPVRITNLKEVDLNHFKFDYDLTFAALMMNPNDGYVYSRFGSRDGDSAVARLSITGLKTAMKDVLAAYSRDRSKHAVKDDGYQTRFTLADIPAYRNSQQAKGECAHCHFANNFRFKQLKNEGRFAKDLLFQYPHPENVGLTLDIDHNTLIKEVKKDSPASRSGIIPGDVLVSAGGAPIYTTADLEFKLNELPNRANLKLDVKRGDRVVSKTLNLDPGWRKTDISWRASQGGIPPFVGIWGEKLPADQRQRLGIKPNGMAIKVTFFFPEKGWADSRGDLRMNDVIVDADGKSLPDMSVLQFHSWFRLSHEIGEKVSLQVLREGRRIDIPVPCVAVGFE